MGFKYTSENLPFHYSFLVNISSRSYPCILSNIYSIETLIVNTVCMHGITGNIHIWGIIFCGIYVGADYNRCLWIDKITQFSYYFGNGWVVVVVVVGGEGFGTFAWRRGERVTKIEQVQARWRGSKFWWFCENVIIECPPSSGKRKGSYCQRRRLQLTFVVEQ